MFCKIVKENRKPLKAIKATAKHRHVEMKKILGGGGAANYETLPATMVGRGRKFFISKSSKTTRKRNICRG